ncbi:hypothetical protein [Streptomyces poriticola]|uniref:hypothetical protein n=1 Tax=Streptomyces poriticola TaxID=3120506 RepID=UPI0038CD2C7C
MARCTIERLMRELGIEGVIRGRRRRTTCPSRRRPARPETWSTAISPPRGRTSCGWRTRRMSAPGRAGRTWRSSWTCTRG